VGVVVVMTMFRRLVRGSAGDVVEHMLQATRCWEYTIAARCATQYNRQKPVQVCFLQRRVKKVEPSTEGGRVTLSDGAILDFDWLVLALGGETNTGAVLKYRSTSICCVSARRFA
jgi:NADH dehydrogenase FAD-containing subunit